MLKHKYINQISIAIIVLASIFAGILLTVKYSSPTKDKVNMEYETKLFDDSKVHKINIKIDQKDWENIQENASDKEYVVCDLNIDGEDFQNVAIRAKGNSSLSTVTTMESERYSFKIEFDHYKDGNTCWGLDKLSLNNIIQDSTYMKDYLSYTLMREMDAYAPLCSYTSVTVNGDDFGLYLAVEGVEDSFSERNFGLDYGNLFKPESADIAGKDGMMQGGDKSKMFGDGKKPDMSQIPKDGEKPDMSQMQAGMGGMFGGGKSDVALQYTDDKISSYSNIFDGSIFDITKTDKQRLISSIKKVNEGQDLDQVLNTEEILKYFVVHNFVDNYDSYTGSLMHNYYLYEKDGKLSMVAWDYNLAFGGMEMGMGMGMGAGIGGDTSNNAANSTDNATTFVNYPIDTPVSGTTMEDRPLLNSLFSNETYLAQYHEYFSDFITNYFDSGYCDKLITSVEEMISPYVKNDKTAFYSYDEFEKGVTTLKEFCSLRAESVKGQLNGEIPSTTEGQKESEALIDASHINLEDMGGSNGMNMAGGAFEFDSESRNNMDTTAGDTEQEPNTIINKDEATNSESENDIKEQGKPELEMGGFEQNNGSQQILTSIVLILVSSICLISMILYLRRRKRR